MNLILKGYKEGILEYVLGWSHICSLCSFFSITPLVELIALEVVNSCMGFDWQALGGGAVGCCCPMRGTAGSTWLCSE